MGCIYSSLTTEYFVESFRVNRCNFWQIKWQRIKFQERMTWGAGHFKGLPKYNLALLELYRHFVRHLKNTSNKRGRIIVVPEKKHVWVQIYIIMQASSRSLFVFDKTRCSAMGSIQCFHISSRLGIRRLFAARMCTKLALRLNASAANTGMPTASSPTKLLDSLFLPSHPCCSHQRIQINSN